MVLLILSAAVTGMAAAYLAAASVRLSAGDSYADSIEVGYAAECGIQHGLCLLVEDPAALSGSNVTALGPYELRTGGPQYTTHSLALAGGQYRFVGTGLSGRYRRTRSAVARLDNGYVELLQSLGPVLHWRLGETSGWTAREQVVGHNGQYVSAVMLNQPGALNGETDPAVMFDGARSRAVIAHSARCQAVQGTVLLWYYDSGADHVEVLFSKDMEKRGSGGGLEIGIDKDKVRVRLESAWADHRIDLSGQPRGTWCMLALSFGPGGMKLYINGQLVGANAYTGGMENNTEPIVLGASQRDRKALDALSLTNPLVSTGLREFFDGRLDEAAFFDRALSAAEVGRLYAARRPLVRIVKWED